MVNTNLENAPEAVRKYLLSLANSGSTVLKVDGRPFARLTLISKERNGTPTGTWTAEKNERRCELVDLEIDNQITPDEQNELRELERQLDRHLDLVAPLPLESLRKLHAELLEEASKTRVDSGA